MTLPIFVYGSDVLRERAATVDLTSAGTKDEISALIIDMKETMRKADGVGLAAPQVGKLLRVLVVDGSPLDDMFPELKTFQRAMVNPVLLEESKDTVEFNEGCLSIPDVHADIVRPQTIKISYIDENFNRVEETLTGFGCRIVQHEMDHLDGVLFVDKAAPIRKKMLSGKLNNIKAGKVKTHYRTIL
jgi:peptide deformylase